MESATQWLMRRVGLGRALTTCAVVGLAANTACTVSTRAALVAAAASAGVVIGLTVHARVRTAAPLMLLAVALLCGLSIGALRVQELFGGALTGWVGWSCTLDVTVVGPPVRTGGVIRAPVRVGPVDPGRADGLAGTRLLLEMRPGARHPRAPFPEDSDPDVALQEGMILRVSGRLLAPEPARPGGFDQEVYLRTRGIALRLEAGAADVELRGRRGGPLGLLDTLRSRSLAHLGIGLSAPWPALLRGVVLGDQQEIPEAMIAAFRRSGTSHILSVSGLHVAALAAAVLMAVGTLPVGRVWRFAAAASIVAGFAVLTGAGPPVTRASVMLLLWLLGRELGRGRDGYQLLTLAGVFVLIRNPWALRDPGAQLSFAAVAGLMYMSRPIHRGLGHALPEGLASGVAVSLAATIATAPLALAHFDQVSVVGVFANLLVVPVVAPVMALGLASIAGGFAAGTVSRVLNELCAALLGWIVTVSEACARAPVLQRRDLALAVAVAAGVFVAVPWCLAVLGLEPRSRLARHVVALVPGRRARWLRRLAVGGSARGDRPALHPRAARRRMVALVAALLMTGAAGGTASLVLGARATGSLSLSWASRDWPVVPEVRVLDVGEGSATLIRTPQRHALLFDAGPSDADLYRKLRGLGVGRLDLVVLSHPHADHAAGLRDIIGRLPVGALLDCVDDRWLTRHAGSVAEAAAYAGMLEDLRGEGTDTGEVAFGDLVTIDGTQIGLVAPREPLGGAWDAEQLNASSVVAWVRAGDLEVLLPGDAEAPVLARYALPPADVLVVPHHGSRDAVRDDVLGALDPRLAIVSVGRDNSYRHPAAETIGALEAARVPVLRTDQAGWVGVRPGDEEEGGLRALVEHPTAVAAANAAAGGR